MSDEEKIKAETEYNARLIGATQQIHAECVIAGKCMETESFKGTKHEGVNVCEDGCVWYKPEKKK